MGNEYNENGFELKEARHLKKTLTPAFPAGKKKIPLKLSRMIIAGNERLILK